ncbi:MAG: hypothetical protein H6672_11180 [Anaerolineaceae bacterium]|nr:hypothetical protein [Anaerolineaceae bacterium]
MAQISEQTPTIAGVRFQKIGKLYHFDYSPYPDLKPGDFVIVETARGRQMGQVMGFAPADKALHEYRSILRIATPRDLVLQQQWQAQQDQALEKCLEIANRVGGFEEVQFVAAEYNYDGSRLTILLSAEDKVNTGRLWYEMDKTFPAQIEMRQIGPRDIAKLLGGYGACGELRCCSTFLTDFSPISIKMAKAQGISLNPSEITGMCGRLRCCLVYEYEQYAEARKHLPKKNKKIGTPFGEAKVIDVHPLQDAVTVITEEGRQLVYRDDIIPLEEWNALQKKSKEPCSKQENGECDCGAKPGKRSTKGGSDDSDS